MNSNSSKIDKQISIRVSIYAIIFLLFIAFILYNLPLSNLIEDIANDNFLLFLLSSVVVSIVLIFIIWSGLSFIIKKVYKSYGVEGRLFTKIESRRFIRGAVLFAFFIMFITQVSPIYDIFTYAEGTFFEIILKFIQYYIIAIFGRWYSKKIISERTS